MIYSVLSAVAGVLLQPLAWVLILMVAVAVVRDSRRKTLLAWAGVGVSLVFTNPWLHHVVSNAWEPAPVTLEEIDRPFDDAIVLGGFTRLHATPADRLHLNADADRFIQAIELFRLGKVKRLIFVGGGRAAGEPHLAEAELAARAAGRFGVPPEAVMALSGSRNTHENAVECRDFFADPTGTEMVAATEAPRRLLVTSASHARRAAGCFRKAGIAVEIFPTGHRSERDHPGRRTTISSVAIPNPGTITSWSPLFHEWLGMAVYRFRGWI